MGPDPRGRRGFLAGLGAVAIGLRLLPAAAIAGETAGLRMLGRSGASPDASLLDAFAKEAGATVAVDAIHDTPAFFDTLREGGYDIVVASDRFVPRLLFADLLQPLERKLIPNLSHIDPAFANARFDAGRRHSVAYLWGTYGIGYRRAAVDAPPASWRWLLDSDRHAGRLALPDDPQLALQVALMYLGHPPDTLDTRQIEAATALLRTQRPRIARFAADDAAAPLREGAVDLALVRNGDVVRARAAGAELDFVVPEEGSLLWQDCLCIPRGSTRKREAHALIDFLLRPDTGARVARDAGCATPNAAARAALPEAMRTDPAVYPPEEVLARCATSTYRGELALKLYERSWREIRGA